MTAAEDGSDSRRASQSISDFSIDHILNRAGSSLANGGDVFSDGANPETSSHLKIDPYSWLQCTRYCPPKVPRTQRRAGPQRRQLGRHPRIPFTSHQLSALEEKFRQSAYLSSEEVIALSNRLQLADVRVKIWFQNRRARERREKSQSAERHLKEENISGAGVDDDIVKTSQISVYNVASDQTSFDNYFL